MAGVLWEFQQDRNQCGEQGDGQTGYPLDDLGFEGNKPGNLCVFPG